MNYKLLFTWAWISFLAKIPSCWPTCLFWSWRSQKQSDQIFSILSFCLIVQVLNYVVYWFTPSAVLIQTLMFYFPLFQVRFFFSISRFKGQGSPLKKKQSISKRQACKKKFERIFDNQMNVGIGKLNYVLIKLVSIVVFRILDLQIPILHGRTLNLTNQAYNR